MMCVKETLPPRARFRWLLMTMRLSISSLAGTARTLVAVGTSSEDSMFVTTRAAGPRRMVVVVSEADAGVAAGAVPESRGTWTGAAWAGAAAGAGAGTAAGAAGAGGAGAGAGTDGAVGAAARGAADVSDVTLTAVFSTFGWGASACAAAEPSVGW